MSHADTLLLITTSYPRWKNGREAAGAFVADLAEALSRQVNIRVVAPGDEQCVEIQSPELSVYRYAAPQRRLVNLRPWNPVEAWKILRTLRAGASAVEAATNDGRVFHMVALWALPSGQWAHRVRRRTGVPYSVWMLGSDVWLLSRIPVVRSVLRRVMRGAVCRFADGIELADASKAICGREVEFLPSTRQLDTVEFDPPAVTKPFRLVFIGRWHRHKGVDLLLDALDLLNEDDWSRIAEVKVYGGGPLAPEVESKVRALARAGRPVGLGGFIPKAEAERAIIRADYLVIPSRVESIPVIFSDAVKLGRPVIATPVGDLPLIFEQAACGVMARDISAAAVSSAIREAVNSSPAMFEQAVRDQAGKFDLLQIARQLLNSVREEALVSGADVSGRSAVISKRRP